MHILRHMKFLSTADSFVEYCLSKFINACNTEPLLKEKQSHQGEWGVTNGSFISALSICRQCVLPGCKFHDLEQICNENKIILKLILPLFLQPSLILKIT